MEKLLQSFQMPSPGTCNKYQIDKTFELVKGILGNFFEYYSNSLIKEISRDFIIQSKIIDVNQIKFDKEKIESLFNYCNQVGKFNEYIINQITKSIDNMKNVFENFILINNFQEQLKRQLDIIYSQITISNLYTDITISELIEQQNNVVLPHKVMKYLERFNPEYPTITSCFIDGEIYITGGYDGKVIFFDQKTIQYELNIMNNPIVQIKKLNNNILLIIDDSNNYALLGNRQITEQGNLNIDSSIVCIEELNEFIGIQFENGEYRKFHSKYGFEKYQKFKLYNDHNLKVLARNDDVVIITDHFNSGSIIINRYDQNQILQSHFVFQIGQHHIREAFIDQDGQNYFINSINEVYLNDEKLETQIEHFVNKQIQYSENFLIVNNIKMQTSLFQIFNVAISKNVLMVVGTGSLNNYEIYLIK